MTPTAESGYLLVDKPAGVTSHDVVARVRRALKTREVGHAGTLDPMATGVLVVAIGEGTKLVQWLTAKVPQRSFAFSRLHGDRLRAIVPGREVVHLTGEYAVLAGDDRLARVLVNLSRYGHLRLIQYTAEMISDLLEGAGERAHLYVLLVELLWVGKR